MKRTNKFDLRFLRRDDDWQIVHGNLMTILMIFFMVLYFLYSTQTNTEYERVVSSLQVKFGGKVNEALIKKAEYKDKEKRVVAEIGAVEGLKKFIRIETDREKIKIIFPDPVIFSPGSADLKPETVWLLGEIGSRLKLLPENEIIVEGHTDDIPISKGGKFSSNWELSLARSLNIVHYLIEVEGLKPERFIPIGFGDNRPLFPNDTPEHRSQNRRIEINIIKKG